MRKWIPKPEYTPTYRNEFYSDHEIIELFLDLQNFWFIDKNNSLYGMKEKIRKELQWAFQAVDLRDYLSKFEPSMNKEKGIEVVYVFRKFNDEWIDPKEGIFLELEIKKKTKLWRDIYDPHDPCW